MKIVNIIEDTTENNELFAEHGLCFYVETEKHKMLIDTGASALTWKNAEKLGIDLHLIDTVILSHGHYDHCGGVMSFAEINSHADIFMHKNAVNDFYNIKGGFEKYIGIDKNILKLKQLKLIDSDLKIDEEISVFSNVIERINWPESNLTLRKRDNSQLVQDDFSHEQYVVIDSENKLVLISGCAHNGIINILNRFNLIYGRDPDYVFSGFHMNRNFDFSSEDLKAIEETADKLSKMKTEFYTGHCTGLPAFELLAERISNIHLIYSGFLRTL